jgi:DNA polymerase-1
LPRDGIVKSMFVSRFGKRGCMYQGDLSQIELRLMAAACGDPTMVKAYFEDVDLHSLTTSRIFKVPYEHFSKDHMKELQEKGLTKEAKELDEKRSIGKTVNFLTGYGGGAFGLQNVLAMKDIYRKIEECQEIIELFFDSYPALRRLLMEYKRFILDSHVAVSLFGRVRVFEEVRGDDEEAKAKALRAGCNHLIQSTASDMMLTALVVIEEMMRAEGLESLLVSTVHDSLVIDAVREELPMVHGIVTDVLNNFPEVFKYKFGENYDTSWMIVPFTGDCEVGTDYLSVRKIPKKDIDWDKLLAPVA